MLHVTSLQGDRAIENKKPPGDGGC
jgi:hypothetical protein